jgi:hypothetical protein
MLSAGGHHHLDSGARGIIIAIKQLLQMAIIYETHR